MRRGRSKCDRTKTRRCQISTWWAGSVCSFPVPDGYATFEQEFVHASLRGGQPQTEFERNNADKVLESEFIALVAASGQRPTRGTRPHSCETWASLPTPCPPCPTSFVPTGRIDLVGITLEIYGPTPSREFRIPGIDRLIQVGESTREAPAANSGADVDVLAGSPGVKHLAGQSVPEGWLVAPHDAPDGSLTAEQVERIITQGVTRSG